MTTITPDTIPEFPKKLTQVRNQRGLTQGQLDKGLLDAFIKKCKFEMQAHS
jgi:hypothetical protein